MPIHELNLKVNLSYGEDYLQDDDGTANHLMFIFWGIVIPIMGVFGLIGNTLTIIVLFRREMKSTTVYFLRTLVVTDSGIIIAVTLGLSVVSITQLNKDLWRFSDVVFPHIYMPINYIVMTLQMINVWVTVAVAIERYIAICHPFRAVWICNKQNAFITIGISVVISVLYNIPRCFATSYNMCGPGDTPTCYTIITTEFGKSTLFSKYYSVYLYMVLIYILPLAGLAVLNTLLIMELMRMRNRRTVSNVRENSEANMSMVLIMIVVVFICCQTPGLVAQFEFLDPTVMLQWLCVSNTLFVLNSSVNFLIYTAVGRKFRKVLMKTFQFLLKKPINELKTTYSQNNSQNGGTELTKLTKNNKVPSESDEVSESCAFRMCK